MDIASAAVGSGVATKSANRLVEALLDGGSKKFKDFLRRKSVEVVAADYAEKNLQRIMFFKTLIDGYDDVYLNDVYYPLSLSDITNKSTTVIEDDVVLRKCACTCIIGRAGQGKTTVMRKLFVEEVKNGEMVPVFITLRKYDLSKYDTCEKLVENVFQESGIECDSETVEVFLSSKKIIFFLDGYDEIPKKSRNHAINIIESFDLKYECSVVLTSRPDTEISRTPNFKHMLINDIGEEDILLYLKKRFGESEVFHALSNLLERKSFLLEAIKSPILLDIFIITFRSLRDDPKSIVDFYDRLFYSLIYSHDVFKNFQRDRMSGLDVEDLEKSFTVVSFLSLAEGNSSFTNQGLSSYFQQAVEYLNFDVSHSQIKEDVLDGTNIICQDGYDNYEYIHRSMQEYYSACFIKTFDPESKQDYFNDIIKGSIEEKGEYHFKLLSMIDPQDFCKFYILPFLKRCHSLQKKVGHNNSFEVTCITKEEFEDVIGDGDIAFEVNGGGSTRFKLSSYFPNTNKFDKKFHYSERNVSVVFKLADILSEGEKYHTIDVFREILLLLSSGSALENCYNEGISRSAENDMHEIKVHEIRKVSSSYDDVTGKLYGIYLSAREIVQEYLIKSQHASKPNVKKLLSRIKN